MFCCVVKNQGGDLVANAHILGWLQHQAKNGKTGTVLKRVPVVLVLLPGFTFFGTL